MQKENLFFFSFSNESTFDRQVKGSANRAKNQIYLSFSGVKPAFDEVKGTNKRGEYQNYSWFSQSDGAARADAFTGKLKAPNYGRVENPTVINIMHSPMQRHVPG